MPIWLPYNHAPRRLARLLRGLMSFIWLLDNDSFCKLVSLLNGLISIIRFFPTAKYCRLPKLLRGLRSPTWSSCKLNHCNLVRLLNGLGLLIWFWSKTNLRRSVKYSMPLMSVMFLIRTSKSVSSSRSDFKIAPSSFSIASLIVISKFDR